MTAGMLFNYFVYYLIYVNIFSYFIGLTLHTVNDLKAEI